MVESRWSATSRPIPARWSDRRPRSRAEAEVAELQAYLARIQDLDAQWRARTADYADTFKCNLDIDIEGAQQELAYVGERLTLERAVAERRQTLARRAMPPRPTPTTRWPR
jgi:hypothetical protein